MNRINQKFLLSGGVGSLSRLQQIFPIQELSQGLWFCRQILYQLSYHGSPWEAGGKQESKDGRKIGKVGVGEQKSVAFLYRWLRKLL